MKFGEVQSDDTCGWCLTRSGEIDHCGDSERSHGNRHGGNKGASRRIDRGRLGLAFGERVEDKGTEECREGGASK